MPRGARLEVCVAECAAEGEDAARSPGAAHEPHQRQLGVRVEALDALPLVLPATPPRGGPRLVHKLRPPPCHCMMPGAVHSPGGAPALYETLRRALHAPTRPFPPETPLALSMRWQMQLHACSDAAACATARGVVNRFEAGARMYAAIQDTNYLKLLDMTAAV